MAPISSYIHWTCALVGAATCCWATARATSASAATAASIGEKKKVENTSLCDARGKCHVAPARPTATLFQGTPFSGGISFFFLPLSN